MLKKSLFKVSGPSCQKWMILCWISTHINDDITQFWGIFWYLPMAGVTLRSYGPSFQSQLFPDNFWYVVGMSHRSTPEKELEVQLELYLGIGTFSEVGFWWSWWILFAFKSLKMVRNGTKKVQKVFLVIFGVFEFFWNFSVFQSKWRF